MHQVRMSGHDGTNFNGELVDGRAQVVERKVEKSDTRVPIKCIDDVSSSLKSCVTPRKV